jgi:hypothetical protein
MNPRTPTPPDGSTPDDAMSEKEKEDFEDQVEEFEGPDRREIRGDNKEPPHDPGIAHS